MAGDQSCTGREYTRANWHKRDPLDPANDCNLAYLWIAPICRSQRVPLAGSMNYVIRRKSTCAQPDNFIRESRCRKPRGALLNKIGC